MQTGSVSLENGEIQQLRNELSGIRDFVIDVHSVFSHAKHELPGFVKSYLAIQQFQKALPPKEEFLTAPQWVDGNYPQLSQRQRIFFYREAASSVRRDTDRSLVFKHKGAYYYSNRLVYLFNQIADLTLRTVPAESKKHNKTIDVKYHYEIADLPEDEQALIGSTMMLKSVLATLKIKPNNKIRTKYKNTPIVKVSFQTIKEIKELV